MLALASVAMMVVAGLTWAEFLRGTVAVAILQVLPGLLLWRLVRPQDGWLAEDLVIGLAVGAALTVPAQVMAGLSGVRLVAWLPAVLVVACVLGHPTERRRVLATRTRPLPWWFGPSVAVAWVPLAATLQRFYLENPLGWSAGFRETYVDLPFHLSVVGELAHRGPVAVPYVAGESLTYHWFSHAWVAHLATTSGVPLDATLFRIGPLLLAAALVAAVAVVAVRLTGEAWSGPLAAGVAVVTADLTIFGGTSPFTAGKLATHGALSLQFATVTEHAADTLVRLPLHVGLTDDDVSRVLEAVTTFEPQR